MYCGVVLGAEDLFKNRTSGASQADAATIEMPDDVYFTIAIADGNHKAEEIQGQIRQHSSLINLLGKVQVLPCRTSLLHVGPERA